MHRGDLIQQLQRRSNSQLNFSGKGQWWLGIKPCSAEACWGQFRAPHLFGAPACASTASALALGLSTRNPARLKVSASHPSHSTHFLLLTIAYFTRVDHPMCQTQSCTASPPLRRVFLRSRVPLQLTHRRRRSPQPRRHPRRLAMTGLARRSRKSTIHRSSILSSELLVCIGCTTIRARSSCVLS